MVKICKKCKTENEDESKHCKECGFPLNNEDWIDRNIKYIKTDERLTNNPFDVEKNDID